MQIDECREKIAQWSHDQWCEFMDMLFDAMQENPDGSYTISKDRADLWQIRMHTTYPKLSDKQEELADADALIKALKLDQLLLKSEKESHESRSD